MQRLATSSTVKDEVYLNSSAILAFTDILRQAQVNNDTAHNRFPVHAYGPLATFDSKDIVNEYIPYLSRQLKSAVRQGDSHKIQVYIRALGNVAHPKILPVFEPYLEGQETMSDFQRLLIVVSMDRMARIYPHVARKVLFNVYQNIGEAHELRVAAVFQLMKTNPPVYMLQRMAKFTNEDTSAQVNAAVKSSIETAARNLQSRTGVSLEL